MLTDHDERLLHSQMRAVDAVRTLHSERTFSGDGYGWSICAECRQAWPCATEKAIQDAEAKG